MEWFPFVICSKIVEKKQKKIFMNEIGMNVSAKFYGKYNTVKTLILTLKHKITKQNECGVKAN